MRNGRILFCLFLIGVAAYAVWAAVGWTFKAKLFPLTVSIPLIILAVTQLLIEIFGKGESAEGPAVDLEFSADVPSEVARRRAIGAFLWVAGFILLVYLLGFPLAVPIFMFGYLSTQSRIGFLLSFGLTVTTWLFFYGLFQRLIHLSFEDGLIQTLLGI
jgi:tripartite tricarboxylate transporter TctB family protein